MEERETGKSQQTNSSAGADAPYAGVVGETRFENVHLVRESGDCASVPVCRVVNVKTHPELRERALDGTLHRLADGRELALSFVYHDPEARKFALVLPTVLAHTELKEWSRLMTQIADDTSCPVPAYVRDNTTVIGALALRRFATSETPTSSGPAPTPPLTGRERELMQRELDVLEQERVLTRGAHELAERERQLQRRESQLATARVDLELREQEFFERQARQAGAELLADGTWHPTSAGSETRAVEAEASTLESSDGGRGSAHVQAPARSSERRATSSYEEPSGTFSRAELNEPQHRYESAPKDSAGNSRAPRISETRALGAPVHDEVSGVQTRGPRPFEPQASAYASAGAEPAAARGAESRALSSHAAEAVVARAVEPQARASLLYETAAAEAVRARSSEPQPSSSPRQDAPHLDRSRLPHTDKVSSDGVLSNRPPPPPGARYTPPIQLRQRQPPPRVVPLHRVPQANDDAASMSAVMSERVAPPAHETPRPREPIAPPDGFAKLQPGQMLAALLNGELWLFAQLDAASRDAFRQGLDLCVQYVEVSAYPVLVISLLGQLPAHSEAGQARTVRLRSVLDGYSTHDMRIVEQLARSFRAQVALYVDGVHWQTLTAAALREGVAQAICEKVVQLPRTRPGVSGRDVARLLRAVDQALPPLTHEDLPFGPSRSEASTTATVLASVEQLARWLSPDKLAEATLSYCTPHHVIDATTRRVLRAAVALGIALPDALMERAIEHRAARDIPSMIRAQLQGFKLRIEQGENDLDPAATRKNWERLLALAAQHHIHVEEVAHAAPAPSRAPAATEGALPAAGASHTRPSTSTSRRSRPFEALSAPELRARLSSAAERLDVIRELCERGHPSSIDVVFGALHTLQHEELPGAMASLLAFGEAAGDGFIAALQSSAPAIRQLAALALGRLRLRRALLPLLKQLKLESSEIHPELARALRDFGPAAVRPLAHAFAGDPCERLIDALAHVASHSPAAALEVERLENDADASVAQAAHEALARRSRIEWEDRAVREQRALGEAQSTLLLSQAFYAELAKVAI